MSAVGRRYAGSPRRLGDRLRYAAAAAAIAALLPLRLAAAPPAAPAVSVTERDGVYFVSARFFVPQPPDAALAVLTDYAEIPRFMPDVTTSVVRERQPGRAVVEQEAVSRVALFVKRVHLVLDIAEDDDALRFIDTCGRSFTRYEGSWRVAQRNAGAEIVYELAARPSFDVPAFLLKRVLTRNAGRMIEQLREAIAARARRPVPER